MSRKTKAKRGDATARDGAESGPDDEQDPADDLDARSRTLVLELLNRRTVQAAALAAGISVRTAFRRMAEPAFQRVLREARAQALTASGTQLAASTSIAAHTLLAVAEDATAPHAARVAAARAVIDAATRFVELDDLAVRLKAIEDRLAVEGGGA